MGNLNKDDANRGLYQKFKVTRTDGSHRPGRRHENCAYFVLDLNHDPFAIPALKAYAKACRKKFPALSADIDNIVQSALPGFVANGLMYKKGSK